LIYFLHKKDFNYSVHNISDDHQQWSLLFLYTANTHISFVLWYWKYIYSISRNQ